MTPAQVLNTFGIYIDYKLLTKVSELSVYEIDDRDEENECVTITDLSTNESITITSLAELKMLFISKNLDKVFEKASQQFIDFLDNRK